MGTIEVQLWRADVSACPHRWKGRAMEVVTWHDELLGAFSDDGSDISGARIAVTGGRPVL
jgi:hypothetical protein